MNPALLRNHPAFVLNRETSPAMWLVGTLWLILVTGVQTSNRSTFLEQLMPSGLGPPAHFHPLAIEAFYVLEGHVTFHVAGKDIPAAAGTVVHIPRMTPHTFTVDSAETRVLNWYAPAGAEMHVISLARPAEERRRPTFEEGPPPKSDEQNQILSSLYGSVAVEALPFSVVPNAELLKTPVGSWTVGHAHVAIAQDVAPLLAFGSQWRFLARSADANGFYDLAEVVMPSGVELPRRTMGVDEALYLLDGAMEVDVDGQRHILAPGCFLYAQQGTVLQWRATADARALIWHFPGGFDEAVAGGRGDDRLVVGWLESSGTRFVEPLIALNAMESGA